VHIIAVVLLFRLVATTEATLNFDNWDKLLLCTLLLAQKVRAVPIDPVDLCSCNS
jgi:hypothetical protein